LVDEDIKYYNNAELSIRNNEGRLKYFDFTYLPTKKIIEFNGDYWHCNPEKYNEIYIHPVKSMSALDIWEYDRVKVDLAESHGYSVLTIWENDYRKDPDKIIKECVTFINN
jgi:hypothetical protein